MKNTQTNTEISANAVQVLEEQAVRAFAVGLERGRV